MNNKTNFLISINWIFGIIFIIIGVLNLILTNIFPGIMYILVSMIYIPPINEIIRIKLKIDICDSIKIVLGLIILWGTLAVGDITKSLGI